MKPQYLLIGGGVGLLALFLMMGNKGSSTVAPPATGGLGGYSGGGFGGFSDAPDLRGAEIKTSAPRGPLTYTPSSETFTPSPNSWWSNLSRVSGGGSGWGF